MASSSSSSPEISAPHSRHRTEAQSLQARLHEVLEDLSSRFILNLPDEELASLERVCFQVEQAHWYYEDFIREEDPSFPTMTLKKFSNSLFHVCPLLSHWGDDHEQTFQNFLAYKTRVPVCGAIMLNRTWDKCLLVKGWKATAAWSFPKGKINEQEPHHRCAVREVLEETGYDLEGQVNSKDVVEISIKEQSIALFIVPNVPEDYPFKTRTRKEISKIAWFKLSDLPTWKRNRAVPGKFYLITPFISPLKAFIRERKPKDLHHKSAPQSVNHQDEQQVSSDEDGNGNPLSTASHEAHAQESGSQSSSADNGEPQTPSPQYSEPSVNHNATGNAATLQIETNGEPLTKEADNIPPQSTQSSPSELPLPPEPSSALPQRGVAQTTNSITEGAKVSCPPRMPPVAASTRPSAISSRPSNHVSRSPSPLTPASTTNSQQSASAPNARTPISPQASSTRRSSGVSADISPYLSRANVTPVIPKQIKYLAMLENVAKESERATPKLERQMASAYGPINHTPHDRPSLSSSVPPNMMERPQNPPLIYSSGLGARPPNNFIPSPNFHALPVAHPLSDPFTVRPRTSNAFHPIPYPSHYPRASMNEEQLRLMTCGSGPRPAPPQNYAGLQRPGPPPLPSFNPRPFPVSPRANDVQAPLHIVPPHFIPTYQYREPGPLSAPATSPTFNVLPRTNASNNAQLLSILNTPNIPHARPAMHPTLG